MSHAVAAPSLAMGERLWPRLDTRRLVSGVVTGVITGLFAITLSFSVAALIFSGPLASHVTVGVGLTLFGSVVLGLFISLRSRYRGMVASAQEVPGAILALIAVGIVGAFPAGATAAEMTPTVVAAIALGSLASGALYWLLGRLRLGTLVCLMPHSVVGGFLAATGWVLVGAVRTGALAAGFRHGAAVIPGEPVLPPLSGFSWGVGRRRGGLFSLPIGRRHVADRGHRTGLAHLVSGLGGGAPGYHLLGMSVLGHTLGADSRITGVCAALTTALPLFFGAGIVTLFPTVVLGGLLIFLGLDFLHTWLWQTVRQLPRRESMTVPLMLAVSIAVGALEGTAAGLVAAVIAGLVLQLLTSRMAHARDRLGIAVSARPSAGTTARGPSPVAWVTARRVASARDQHAPKPSTAAGTGRGSPAWAAGATSGPWGQQRPRPCTRWAETWRRRNPCQSRRLGGRTRAAPGLLS